MNTIVTNQHSESTNEMNNRIIVEKTSWSKTTPISISSIIALTTTMLMSSLTNPTVSITTNIFANNGTLITFDNLTSLTPIPNGYKNIIWTNAYSFEAAVNDSGCHTAMITSPSVMFNAYGNPMTIQSANSSRISLYSLAVAAAWNDNLQLTIVGYSSNAVIASNTYTLQVFTVSNLTFTGYVQLDKIIFTTSGGTRNPNVTGNGTQFGMDDICLKFT